MSFSYHNENSRQNFSALSWVGEDAGARAQDFSFDHPNRLYHGGHPTLYEGISEQITVTNEPPGRVTVGLLALTLLVAALALAFFVWI